MFLFERNILSIYKDRGRAWLKALPGHVQDLSKKYGLSNLTPVNNLSHHYVLSGLQGEKPIILKLGLDVLGLKRETAALKIFSGYGAVCVFAEDEGLLLLERAIPGDSLKTFSANEALVITCQVMKRLHEAPLPSGSLFSSMKEYLAALDQTWDLPSEYLDKARKLRDRLLAIPGKPVLLHGDLHHENILRNGEMWDVIDPKGIIGSPLNEVWAFVRDVERDPVFIAQFFGFCPQDVRDWYFVHTVLAACWNLEDQLDPSLFKTLAARAYALM